MRANTHTLIFASFSNANTHTLIFACSFQRKHKQPSQHRHTGRPKIDPVRTRSKRAQTQRTLTVAAHNHPVCSRVPCCFFCAGLLSTHSRPRTHHRMGSSHKITPTCRSLLPYTTIQTHRASTVDDNKLWTLSYLPWLPLLTHQRTQAHQHASTPYQTLRSFRF